MRHDGGMSEFDWATADPQLTVAAMPTYATAPIRGLLDADADDAEPLPVVPEPARGDDETLVLVEHPRIRCLNVYQRHGFPAAVGGCYLREAVAVRLGEVADYLPEPFGLAIFDAWRDPQLQGYLYDRVYGEDPAVDGLPPGFVAQPSDDPRQPTPHSTGGTVDLTLSWNGTPLALGTDFDEFTELAFTDALESPVGDTARVARDLRRMLVSAMHTRGFVVLAREWWHFEYGTRLWSAVMDRPARYSQAARPPLDAPPM